MKNLSIILVFLLLIGSPLILTPAHASDTPAPASVTVVGSLQSELGCPGDWQPDCAATHLAFDANDNVWQNTFSVPTGSWEYKAALNDSWDENYGAGGVAGGSNIGLNLAAPASVKFYYDHETHWITDNVNSVIATAPGSYQSEIGCSGDWDPGCLRSWLQDPDGDGIYTFSTNAIPPGDYELKVAINEGWDINYGAGGVQNGPNILFTVSPSTSKTLFSYDAATHILSVSTIEAPSSVTVVGSLQSELGCPGDWQPDCAATHLVFDPDDDIWQNTFSIPTGSWEYKAVLNDSWTENYGAGAERDGPNIMLNLGAPASVKFYYDHKTHWITDNVNSIIATVPGSYQSEIGCPGDWQPDCLRSWLQDPDGDGIYAFSTNAIPPGNYEVKVAINESWDINYGAGGEQNGPNIQFTVEQASCADVLFSYDSVSHVLSVTAPDIIPPVITCPSDITINSCTGAETGDYMAEATDNCSIQSLICTPPSGADFPVGTTNVSCTATDPAGNSATCSFDVKLICPICRAAGFWGTHAGEECPKKRPDCGSNNITQAVINGCDNQCLGVCGEIITNTDLDSANSAIEAICVNPGGDTRLQLARQLATESLNCCISAGKGDCEGLDVWDNLFSFCNSVCALNISDSFDYCIDALNCLNSGGNVIELMNDTPVIGCQTGTCQPSSGGVTPCGKNLLPCPPGSACVQFEETCHTREFCNDDLGLCFDAAGPAGSSNACSAAMEGTVTGTGKDKVRIPNNCTILPMPNPPSTNCAQNNQGEECCSNDSEESCEACAHSLCETGFGLDLFCDACVTAVCYEHPECCNNEEAEGWNSPCVYEAVAVCGISCNEIGWANLQWPPAMTHTIGAIDRTDNVYGQVWIDGVTNQPGPTLGLLAQLGFGPVGSNPDGNPGWVWVDATFNVDAGSNDEFVASMLPDSVGEFDYLYRYSTTNGLFWLYADLNGPVTSGALPPNPGKLTVISGGDTTPPSTPGNLIVVSSSISSIEIAWDAVMGDPTLYGYEVLRSAVSGGPYTVIASLYGATSYMDTDVQTGETYFYVVRAVDLSFNRSGNSNEVQAIAQLRTVTVTFNVTVPSNTDATGSSVYIAGTLDRLNGGLPAWDPSGVVLTRVDSTHWTITLTGNENTALEYRYTLGSWAYVEKGCTCEEISNRQLTLIYGSDGTQTVNDTVCNWRNVAPCGN